MLETGRIALILALSCVQAWGQKKESLEYHAANS
jgi:hypothetical protein